MNLVFISLKGEISCENLDFCFLLPKLEGVGTLGRNSHQAVTQGERSGFPPTLNSLVAPLACSPYWYCLPGGSLSISLHWCTHDQACLQPRHLLTSRPILLVLLGIATPVFQSASTSGCSLLPSRKHCPHSPTFLHHRMSFKTCAWPSASIVRWSQSHLSPEGL